jgi:hypothetical protein
MKKLIGALGIAGLLSLAVAATVAAAGPHQGGGGPATAAGGASGVVADVLGMTRAEIQAQRQAGASLATIAEGKGIDPTRLIAALRDRWATRIDARVAAGALTTAEATDLKANLEVRAKDMVYRVTTGGMQGAAVGAGPASGAGRGQGRGGGAGAGRGAGPGAGACDGTGLAGGAGAGPAQP